MLRVKHERLRRGWSQVVLAFHSRVTPPDLSRIENGRLLPTERQRTQLAEALGLDASTLLETVPEAAQEPSGGLEMATVAGGAVVARG